MDKNFFLDIQNPMQRRYETLRAAYVENMPSDEIAKKFNYTLYSFKSLKRDSKNFDADYFFKDLKKGAHGHHEKTLGCYERIIELRKKNFSVTEITEKLIYEGTSVSTNLINTILAKEGFTKLFRRTNRERLEALQSDKKYPEYADVSLFCEKQSFITRFGGIFLFLPLIIDLKLDQIFLEELYGTTQIPRISYMLSYLALKLLGKERLSHINDFSFDHGLGTFAGLNVLPKSTSISSYSYHHSKSTTRKILKAFLKLLQINGYIKGQNINLDFHTIPFYGEEATLNKNFAPMKGKSVKSVLSFFAQDLDTTFLCFSDGELKTTYKKM